MTLECYTARSHHNAYIVYSKLPGKGTRYIVLNRDGRRNGGGLALYIDKTLEDVKSGLRRKVTVCEVRKFLRSKQNPKRLEELIG